VYALARRREREGVLAGLRRLAGSAAGIARRDALLALRRHGDPGDADVFADALDDPDPRVRLRRDR
jgi:hypothetical protein